jgi:hypothetical protein
MTFNEANIEDAWFGEQGYAALHGPQLAPGQPAPGRADVYSRVKEALG